MGPAVPRSIAVTSAAPAGMATDGAVRTFRVAPRQRVKQRTTMTKKNQSFQDGGEVLDFAAHGYTFHLQQRENTIQRRR